MKGISKFCIAILCVLPITVYARAVVSRATQITNTPTSGYTYNYMYPYMNNQMRQTLNPGDTGSQSANPINAVVKTNALANNSSGTTGQSVSGRSGRSARSATSSSGTKTTSSSVRVSNGTATNNSAGQGRNVVARSGRVGRSATSSSGTKSTINASLARATSGNSTRVSQNTANRRVTSRNVSARSARTTTSRVGTTTLSSSDSGIYVSSSRCLSDYTECMDSYCSRSDTEYDRCFCSSRLSQIDATYQPEIDSLVKSIITAQTTTTTWTDAEMAEYWQDKVGQYVGENSWAKLDDALDIDWPDSDETMQGQNAYLIGHEYCSNNLINCAYASANMRDVYRSEITRDCTTYENSLKKLKTALETALEAYQD